MKRTQRAEQIMANPQATPAQIAALQAPDAILHPNCPAERWWELAKDLPIEAMQSPLFPLLTLESPERWAMLAQENHRRWIEAAAMLLSWSDARKLCADYAEHVLPIFERNHPEDLRPREAIRIGRLYADDLATLEEMVAASKATHEAAREVRDDASDYAAEAARSDAVDGVAENAAQAAAWALEPLPTQDDIRNASRIRSRVQSREAERRWQWQRLLQYLQGGAQVGNLARVGADRSRAVILSDPQASEEEVESLDFLEQLAHPNCPPGRWWCLARYHPSEAMDSVLYPVLTLEEPARWREDVEKANVKQWITDALPTLSAKDLRLWAADCAAHVLPIFETPRIDDWRPRRATEAARLFANGKLSVQEVLDASDEAAGCVDAPNDQRHVSYAAANAAYITLNHPTEFAQAASDAAAYAMTDASEERHWQWKRLQAYQQGKVRDRVGGEVEDRERQAQEEVRVRALAQTDWRAALQDPFCPADLWWLLAEQDPQAARTSPMFILALESPAEWAHILSNRQALERAMQRGIPLEITRALRSYPREGDNAPNIPLDLLLAVVQAEPETHSFYAKMHPLWWVAFREIPALFAAMCESTFDDTIKRYGEAILGEGKTYTFKKWHALLRRQPDRYGEIRECADTWPDSLTVYPSGVIREQGERINNRYWQSWYQLWDHLVRFELGNSTYFYNELSEKILKGEDLLPFSDQAKPAKKSGKVSGLSVVGAQRLAATQEQIEDALRQVGGSPTEAARLLKIGVVTIYRLIKRYGIPLEGGKERAAAAVTRYWEESSPEEIARHRRELSDSARRRWTSQEEIDLQAERGRERWDRLSEEDQQEISQRGRQRWEILSEEEQATHAEMTRRRMEALPEEEWQVNNQRLVAAGREHMALIHQDAEAYAAFAASVKAGWARMSPEDREAYKEKKREYFHAQTPEQQRRILAAKNSKRKGGKVGAYAPFDLSVKDRAPTPAQLRLLRTFDPYYAKRFDPLWSMYLLENPTLKKRAAPRDTSDLRVAVGFELLSPEAYWMFLAALCERALDVYLGDKSEFVPALETLRAYGQGLATRDDMQALLAALTLADKEEFSASRSDPRLLARWFIRKSLRSALTEFYGGGYPTYALPFVTLDLSNIEDAIKRHKDMRPFFSRDLTQLTFESSLALLREFVRGARQR